MDKLRANWRLAMQDAFDSLYPEWEKELLARLQYSFYSHPDKKLELAVYAPSGETAYVDFTRCFKEDVSITDERVVLNELADALEYHAALVRKAAAKLS